MKKSYLIQEGKFKDVSEISGLDSVIRYEYMGSSEFEWGALPKSLKSMLWDAEQVEFFKIKKLKNKFGKCVRVLCKPSDLDSVIENIFHISQNKYGYKEACHFSDRFDEKQNKSYREDVNFWWDIQNNFIFFFSEEHEKMLKTAFRNMKNNEVLKNK